MKIHFEGNSGIKCSFESDNSESNIGVTIEIPNQVSIVLHPKKFQQIMEDLERFKTAIPSEYRF